MNCLNCARRATCVDICAEVEAELPSMEAGRIAPEKAYSVQEKVREIDILLERSGELSARERCVLHLFYRTDLPATDIAAALRVSRDTVYSTVHRSIRKISGIAADSRRIQRGRQRRAA